MSSPDAIALNASAAAWSPWKRGLAWLFFLGPFFFLSYGLANHVAAERGVTDTLVFDWERRIPFVPWTILPYWSIDLLYGLSFLCCRDRREMDIHAYRLLTAQLVAVCCFLLFPLHFSFPRPAVDGVAGVLFEALAGFDQPYNQAPSLHIALLVVIWARFAAVAGERWRRIVDGWAVLIAISVLTTYQHHFIDLPTGALLGFLCLWLWPDRGISPLRRERSGQAGRRRQLAARYLIGAGSAGALAAVAGGALLWFWWIAASLALVAWVYLMPGANGFQKAGGRHSPAVLVLFAPYLVAAWLNSRWWTRKRPRPDPVVDGVWLGRMPACRDIVYGGFTALVDFCAELPVPRTRPNAARAAGFAYRAQPWLDLVAPDAPALREAARCIEEARLAAGATGPVLVCCALGASRSAVAVAAWLLVTGRAEDAVAAESIVRRSRPGVVLSDAHRAALAHLAVDRSRLRLEGNDG